MRWGTGPLVGNMREVALIQPVGSGTVVMFDDCGCIVTSRNFHFKAICKVQPLRYAAKLLATIANSMFNLCFVFLKVSLTRACMLTSVH